MVSQFCAIWSLDIPLNPQKFWFHWKSISSMIAFLFYVLSFMKTAKKKNCLHVFLFYISQTIYQPTIPEIYLNN